MNMRVVWEQAQIPILVEPRGDAEGGVTRELGAVFCKALTHVTSCVEMENKIGCPGGTWESGDPV